MRAAVNQLLMITMLAIGQAECVDAAIADRAAQPTAANIRYLVLPEGKDWAPVLSGHCNQLSRESDITRPTAVGGNERVVRINLDDYTWPAELWDQLADADPWYHVRIEVDEICSWPGGNWPGDGKHYPAGSFRYHVKTQRATALAPWMGPNAGKLAEMCRTRAPILRADWFFNQTAIQADRRPGYYDFLGVKNEADFQKLIGFDAKKKRRRVEVMEAVAESGVSLQDRAIIREDDAYWITYDFRRAKEKVNPLQVLGRDIQEEFRRADKTAAASEQYGQLPNYFWATFLGNSAGERQDSAPDFIAHDHRSKSNDKRVHVNASCMRCHANAGLQDIDGWVRNLAQPPLALQSPDYEVYRLLRQQYIRRLEPFLERDRRAYTEAVQLATGWDAKVYAAKYAAAWEYYEDARVDAAWAARDCHLPEKEFLGKLAAYTKATRSIDLVLGNFLHEGPRRRTVSIRQWEAAFPKAMEILRGIPK